jgi:hypothetical protein
MTRTLLLAVAVAVAAAPLAGCARSAPPAPPTAEAPPGKPGAPVDVDARVLGDRAHVTFRFFAPSEGVRIDVKGVGGLVVTSAPALVQNGTFERGVTAEYDVTYAAPPPAGRQPALAVSVTGTFGGQPRARILTFPVGEPAPAPKAGPAATGQDADDAKALPADPTTPPRR